MLSLHAREVVVIGSCDHVLRITAVRAAIRVGVSAQTGRISVASGKCGLGVSTARHWMSRGRNEESGLYREFLDDVCQYDHSFKLPRRDVSRTTRADLLWHLDKTASSCRMLNNNYYGGPVLDIERIVTELEQERDRISHAIALLKGVNSSSSMRKTGAGKGRSAKRRSGGMSPAARKRLSELMKKRWAEKRKKAKSS